MPGHELKSKTCWYPRALASSDISVWKVRLCLHKAKTSLQKSFFFFFNKDRSSSASWKFFQVKVEGIEKRRDWCWGIAKTQLRTHLAFRFYKKNILNQSVAASRKMSFRCKRNRFQHFCFQVLNCYGVTFVILLAHTCYMQLQIRLVYLCS